MLCSECDVQVLAHQRQLEHNMVHKTCIHVVFCVWCVGTGPPETPRTHLAHKESQAAPAFGSPALPAGRQAGMLRCTYTILSACIQHTFSISSSRAGMV